MILEESLVESPLVQIVWQRLQNKKKFTNNPGSTAREQKNIPNYTYAAVVPLQGINELESERSYV